LECVEVKRFFVILENNKTDQRQIFLKNTALWAFKVLDQQSLHGFSSAEVDKVNCSYTVQARLYRKKSDKTRILRTEGITCIELFLFQ